MTTDPLGAPLSGQVTLDDGRRLGWYQFGKPSGRPAFYFHGFPGSGVEARWGHGAATTASVRLIGLDRPGFGRSSFDSGRTILGWADDVLAVADALDIARFSVLGMSGGAPYALACAARLPQRVTRTMIVSGLGPMPEGGIAASFPGAFERMSVAQGEWSHHARSLHSRLPVRDSGRSVKTMRASKSGNVTPVESTEKEVTMASAPKRSSESLTTGVRDVSSRST